jgi:hypothetical protein
MHEPSKTPIADLGDDFEPESQEDFAERQLTGEFEGKTEDEIRDIYVREEADDNHEHEQRLIDEEEALNDDDD